jgi:hypothetical protein
MVADHGEKILEPPLDGIQSVGETGKVALELLDAATLE